MKITNDLPVIPENPNNDHFTLRVPHSLMQKVREFKTMAREHKVDSGEYLRQVLDQAVTNGLQALQGKEKAA